MTRAERCAGLLLDVLAWLGRELPELRACLVDVDVTVKDQLDDVDRARGATEDLQGYYWGLDPVYDQGGDGVVSGPGCPDRIERMAPGDREAIVIFAHKIHPLTKEAVAKVFLHELGHFAGFDEWELTEGMGLQ